jgi:hypothetical protein
MANHYPANLRGGEVFDTFTNTYQFLIEGEWTAEQASEEMTKAIQEVLDKPEA